MVMSKGQWQRYHGFTDDEMDLISMIKDLMNGEIVSIRNIPLDKNGQPITFALRQERELQ